MFNSIKEVKNYFNISNLPWHPAKDYKDTGNIESKTKCGNTIIRKAFGKLFTVSPPLEYIKLKNKLLNDIEILEEEIGYSYTMGHFDDLNPAEFDLAKLHKQLDKLEQTESLRKLNLKQ